MYKRIYVDNNIVTYIKDILFKESHNNSLQILMEKASLVYLSTLTTIKLEFLFSGEVLKEIQALPEVTAKRIELEAVWQAFQRGKKIAQNTKNFEDMIAFFNKKGNRSKHDAQHIANAMLPENGVDILMTNDDGIWKHRIEIESEFGVKVMKPSELAEYYRFLR